MPNQPTSWDEPDKLNAEFANRESVPVPPPSSGAGDAPGSRWGAFTEEEIRTINIALIDSGSIRGDFDWYLRCSNLHIELVAVIASWERALAKARGEKPDAR